MNQSLRAESSSHCPCIGTSILLRRIPARRLLPAPWTLIVSMLQKRLVGLAISEGGSQLGGTCVHPVLEWPQRRAVQQSLPQQVAFT